MKCTLEIKNKVHKLIIDKFIYRLCQKYKIYVVYPYGLLSTEPKFTFIVLIINFSNRLNNITNKKLK